MTDEPKPKRPGWRNKRWWFAAALLLAVPLSVPYFADEMMYAAGRGDFPDDPAKLLSLHGWWRPTAPGPFGPYQSRLADRYAKGQDHAHVIFLVETGRRQLAVWEAKEPDSAAVRAQLLEDRRSLDERMARVRSETPAWYRWLREPDAEPAP